MTNGTTLQLIKLDFWNYYSMFVRLVSYVLFDQMNLPEMKHKLHHYTI